MIFSLITHVGSLLPGGSYDFFVYSMGFTLVLLQVRHKGVIDDAVGLLRQYGSGKKFPTREAIVNIRCIRAEVHHPRAWRRGLHPCCSHVHVSYESLLIWSSCVYASDAFPIYPGRPIKHLFYTTVCIENILNLVFSGQSVQQVAGQGQDVLFVIHTCLCIWSSGPDRAIWPRKPRASAAVSGVDAASSEK